MTDDDQRLPSQFGGSSTCVQCRSTRMWARCFGDEDRFQRAIIDGLCLRCQAVSDGLAVEECPECSGSGDLECGECGGRPSVRVGDADHDHEEDLTRTTSTCPACKGTGQEECFDCSGAGLIVEEERSP